VHAVEGTSLMSQEWWETAPRKSAVNSIIIMVDDLDHPSIELSSMLLLLLLCAMRARCPFSDILKLYGKLILDVVRDVDVYGFVKVHRTSNIHMLHIH
jgi:hypothetical protein